uniref:Dickkopf WNT signaling pathway inhibitor 2 n=1 Tax=Ornithorhynchus anatinus TaxID=9258 RepID=A0A6I8P429_ORNAN
MRAPRPGPAPARCLLLLAAFLVAEGSQLGGGGRPKPNSIKASGPGEPPTRTPERPPAPPGPPALRPAAPAKAPAPPKTDKRQQRRGQAYPCSSDKECEVGRYCHSPHQGSSACMVCRRKKKRCHRDGMCCPGTRCNNGICVPVTESILTPHIPALDGTRQRDRHNGHYSNHDLGWQNLGRPHSKQSHIKGHEGDPCLRSSDCIEGFCCARHFWTKICKPVLHQGEVCTKQRKKGSHGLEIFQRCDCARELSCKVWKDATYSSKSRLHVCQKI